MISILKSHSSARPFNVDEDLKDTTSFVGEEVDICGRWDADSPCFRHLLADGNPSVPMSWKHKFCHTSVQTICHCIRMMFDKLPGPLMLHTASGLYVRRCFDCGEKLQLQPLHSLVMTAYLLANLGCQNEDLFGMLAILLCLVSGGVNPCQTANVSVTAFMQPDAMETVCDHIELTAAGLAEKILEYPAVNLWNSKARCGWEVLCGVLRLCEDNQMDSDDEDEDEDFFWNRLGANYSGEFIGNEKPSDFEVDTHMNFHLESRSRCSSFRRRKDLASLWASVQAELLTYRHLHDDANWLSPRFSMQQLRDQLDRGESLAVGYVEQDLLKTHCICGRFEDHPLALVDDVTDPTLQTSMCGDGQHIVR